MNNGLTLDEVAARYKRGDLIRWLGAPSKYRPGHKGEGKYQGTLDGKIFIEYLVSVRFGQWKTVKVDHTRIILEDDGAAAA